MKSASRIFCLRGGLIAHRLCIEIAYIGEIVYKIHAEEVKGRFCCSDCAKKSAPGDCCVMPDFEAGGSPKDLEPAARDVFLQLEEYFSGRRKKFSFQFSFAGTPFQQAVWRELLAIPYGETASYSQIAERAGRPKAFRAAARACHDNPLPFAVPCHRVIAKNGSLCGFAFGPDIKAYLLNLEQRNR